MAELANIEDHLALRSDVDPAAAFPDFLTRFEGLGSELQLRVLDHAQATLGEKPAGDARAAWGTRAFQIAAMLALTGKPQAAFEVVESKLWEGANWSFTSWKIPHADAIDSEVARRILYAHQDLQLREISEDQLTSLAYGSLLTQRANHLAKNPQNRDQDNLWTEVNAMFERAAEVFLSHGIEHDSRGSWACRQWALRLQDRYKDNPQRFSGSLDQAIEVIQLAIERSDKGCADNVRGPDHIWHQYACRCNELDLLEERARRDLRGQQPDAYREELNRIGQGYDDVEEKFATRDPRWGCGLPGYNRNRFFIELGELELASGNTSKAHLLFMRAEERAARSLQLENEQYKGSPRPFNTGIDHLAWGWATLRLGRKEDSLGHLTIAKTLLNPEKNKHHYDLTLKLIAEAQ